MSETSETGRAASVDGDELLPHIGIDDDEIAWRKEYTGLDEASEKSSEISDAIDEIAAATEQQSEQADAIEESMVRLNR